MENLPKQRSTRAIGVRMVQCCYRQKMATDWDFSMDGRIRQALRMQSLAEFGKIGRTVIFILFTQLLQHAIYLNQISWYGWTQLREGNSRTETSNF